METEVTMDLEIEAIIELICAYSEDVYYKFSFVVSDKSVVHCCEYCKKCPAVHNL